MDSNTGGIRITMHERGQTNVDFAFAGLALTIFVSATLLVPASPLFSFTNTEIDHQIGAEQELVRIGSQELTNSKGEITTQAVCDYTNTGSILTKEGTKANITFSSIDNQGVGGLSANTISGCDNSIGPPVANTVITTANKTIIVDGELTKMTIRMWESTN